MFFFPLYRRFYELKNDRPAINFAVLYIYRLGPLWGLCDNAPPLIELTQ